MKFFKLDASPTVQWMRQVVVGQATASQSSDLLTATSSSDAVELTKQHDSEDIAHTGPDPLLNPDQDSFSAFDPVHTAQTQETPMQKLKKSEPTFSTQPIANTSKNSDRTSTDWSIFDRNGSGSSEMLLDNADLQWLLSISQRMHQAETLEALLKTIVTDVRQHFNVDRVLIYQFQTETHGIVAAESLTEGYTPSLNKALPAIAFGAKSLQEARQQVVSLNDIAQVSLSPHQHQIMAQFQTQASLSVPILLDQVWGLLVVQQCTHAQQWKGTDLTLLYKIVTELRLGLQSLELRQEKLKAEQYEQALPSILNKISDAAYLENACQTAVQEVQQLLNVERVAIYKFRPDYFGDFIYESESGDWPTLVGSAWEDTYMQEKQGGRFRTSEPYIADDVYAAGLSDCHIDTLEYFGVKSFAVVAIKQGEKLWGLLSAFQHSGPRHWLGREVTLLAEVGRQLGTTLQDAAYLMQLQEQSTQMTQVARISHALAEIIPEIRQSQNLETVFRTTKQSVRRLLKCDRVAMYQFRSDWSSKLVAEYAKKGLDILEDAKVGAIWPQVDLQAMQGGPYRNREHLAVNNIHTAGFTPEQIEVLVDFEIQALMIAPIFKGNELWGLLGVYQSTEPRSWATVETNALTQIATQVGVAMQQVDYLELTSKQMTRDAEQKPSQDLEP